LRDRIMSAVSGLLGLMGINADPIQSREHILLSNILDRAWREGRSLDIAGIIMDIQKPPFEKIGVFDLGIVLSGQGAVWPGHGAEQPDRLAGLLGLDGGRAAGYPAPALHRGGQARASPCSTSRTCPTPSACSS
jgi:hypothetical protein